MNTQNVYDVLQVQPDADGRDIEAAYQRLREQYDPARLPDAAPELRELAAARYAQITAAYHTLSQPAVPADELDYRPLPPRHEAATVRPIAIAAATGKLTGWRMLALALALIAAITTLLIWQGTRAPVATAPQNMPLFARSILNDIGDPQVRDQLLALDATAAQARNLTQQDPRNPQAWVLLGNAHYDFIQTIYEIAPTSEAYSQNLSRWLEANDAYAQALEINPVQPVVRSDRAVALVRYGIGLGNPGYIDQGVAEADQALSEDDQTPQVLLNIGRVYALAQPPRTADAQRLWRRIIELAPASPQAARAQLLLDGATP